MKRSVFWVVASLASIGYLGAMVISGALPEFRHRVKFEAKGLMTVAPERIDRVEIERSGTRIALVRTGTGGWSREGGEALSVTVADKVSLAVQYMHTSGPVRVMTAEEIRGFAPTEFGLDPPRISVVLFAGRQRVLQAHFGARNPEDILQYMTLAGHDGMYLMSRFVGQEWDSRHDELGCGRQNRASTSRRRDPARSVRAAGSRA
jgi:hypothetical protein